MVSDNSLLSGTLPKEFCTMSLMEIWSSSGTSIDSSIPDEWSAWNSLAEISV